ncbi:hypothetical protein J0383_00940 [Flavobacterium endoglycinae]|uniref:DUF1735 domain-containing protein n=1 Tax=Flavobacterium endoglycinae TaxID=2816357 RepID=A0ABX7QFZ1_9FLAO|nr:hypothetical protein [Flavobacterium endoglycinae]QSW89393.1 hypothetical protein J0383_00940 [Flavobacterium endoglycinae]
MNRIKILSLLVAAAALLSSCSKDDYRLDSTVDPFVRFNFLTTSAGVPLEYPAVSTSTVPLSSYENKSVKTLKIPVALTHTNLKSAVSASFSAVSSSNDNESFTVNPVNELVFQGTKLTDTIFVSFNKRWTENQSITLKLETISDPNIHIGNLNTTYPNNSFKIDLGTIATNYTFPVNRIVIKGEAGETVDFKVNFPNGFFPSEIDNLEIFKFLDGFNYSLSHDPYGDNRSSITYHLTLLESIQNDDVYYESSISLVNTGNYTATGNTILQIVKPIKSTRDVNANPASKFYDLSNQFYLTYGETWFDKSGTCAWQAYNAFTFPVVVTKDHENAILYSDKGTTNPNDDVYHDAFRIGFNVASGTNTTNSFNLKRWFSNESTTAANSPGFNITSALEFFPANGNSKTEGNVLVIPQYITITGTNKNSHSIAISGSGTYKEISSGLFEITFELKLMNEELFGGTVTAQYRMYNNKTYPKPAALSIECPKEVAL